MICIIFRFNKQSLRNKRHNLPFIEKSKKPYKLVKYYFFSLYNIHILIQENFRN